MKTKTRSMHFLAMEYKQMELYFESMALKGWEYKTTETYFFGQNKEARFTKITPTTIHYCVDFVDDQPLEYFETCKQSGWTHVDTTKYFHIFKHVGDAITPLQSDEDIESEILSNKVYRKELHIFYRGFILPLLFAILSISRLLMKDYTVEGMNRSEDILILIGMMVYGVYLFAIISLVKRMMVKRTFLSKLKKPLSRFLGLYPFSIFCGITIVIFSITNIQEGKPIIEPSYIILGIIISSIVLAWHTIQRWSQDTIEIQKEKK